jgi:glycosyltransferase involved in cell wall biosynthesis
LTPPRKILFVTPGLRQGGAERQLLELMRRLPPRFAPTLCIYDGTNVHYGAELPPGEPRHVLGVTRMTPRGLKKLAQVIAEERPDILHSVRDRSNLWTRVAMAAYGVRVPVVIASVRNRNIDPLNLLAEEHLIDRTDLVLANSQGIRRELVDRARIPAGRIEVIHNFIDTSRFHPPKPAQRQSARARWELGDELALLLPGRLALQKHQVGLMFALWACKRAGRLPANVRVLLAGRTRDALYTRVVRGLVKLFGLQQHVRFLGPVTDMVSLYHAADALLLPSLYEGMPNAVIESQVSGLPAIVSRAANADDLVIDGEGGFEVPTADREALATAIGKLCALPAEERARMGARGRERVTRMLDQDAILAKVVATYDRLLAEKIPAPAPSPGA